MKTKQKFFPFFLLSLFLLPLSSQAGPTADITETAMPPRIDGDLSDWTVKPVIVLDKKENVDVGQDEWTGPDYASAKIYVTYDKTNLYIGAAIKSKTPQYNGMNASNIYNGDALECYVGTDLSNPVRKSYAPTDVQFIISPGKNGDGAEVYSATDKGDIPGARVATELIPGGYTLEASVPLKYFYKLDVGPAKSIGFDVALDDVGAASKVRTLQMSWSGSSTSWQDPSVWGALQFTGKTVFVNKAPKMTMPGAVQVEMDPMAGKKDASKLGTLLWGFNGDLGGFKGKVSQEAQTLSEGTGAMRIDTDGSSGWNQNLAVSSDIPMADKWVDFKAISLDIYFPAGSLAKAGYGELYMITQSPANSWYEIKMKMNEGWNHIKQDVDGSQFKGGVTKAYLVFNSGGPITGSVVIDNIRGVLKGAPAVLEGKVLSKSGRKPVVGAEVAIAKKLVKTDRSGSFKINLPEDDYTAEVFSPGYESYRENLQVNGKMTHWKVYLKPDVAIAKKAEVDVYFDKKIRTINPHYMYGNNIAAWYDPKWLTDPAALKKTEAISSYFRLPGGAYANIWRWKTGEVLRKDGKTVQWTPDCKWSDMADFVKSVPGGEPLLIANIMTMDVQNALEWIADAKARGLKVNYVELGNEPDYEADMVHDGQTQYWTVIDNYCRQFIEFAKAIKAKYPDIKIMGPAIAQVGNRERKEGSPWLASENSPWWVERFLQECGPYVDVVSVHSYPYWSNDSDSNLLSKISLWSEYVPKIREAIKKYIPNRYQQVQIAVTEWNSGDENATTARLVNGIFCADFLAQMMVWGVNQSNIWDLFTQKPGLGGGHGVMDPNNDPDHPFAERASYWALDMMEHHFGTTLYQAVSSSDDLDSYASTANGKKYLMVINKSPKYAYKTVLNLGKSLKGRFKPDFYELSSREYQWSENLYRAVINSGPAHLKSKGTIRNRFEYTFPPYSITCIELEPVR